jgi:succinate dehydrogenase/fumarate reductase flavoprotein subunit
VLGPLGRPVEAGWYEHQAQLQEAMGKYMHITRTRLGMERGVALLERLQDEGEQLGAANPHDLMRTLEGADLVLFDRMMIAAALARDESRFGYLLGHYRADFPGRDDGRWKGVANVVTWSDGEPLVGQRKMS